ncbi:unnamed protein product [Paramecium sonneborni]|uniref:Uncharacterized protein n=1 Tax=Paramecium sonneborni TaxID=65129 RepID=A0A8S1QUE3_9CILI|nr:unnamed protein product [Paramecium sonneborni]
MDYNHKDAVFQKFSKQLLRNLVSIGENFTKQTLNHKLQFPSIIFII